jgi:hypothetical protein
MVYSGSYRIPLSDLCKRSHEGRCQEKKGMIWGSHVQLVVGDRGGAGHFLVSGSWCVNHVGEIEVGIIHTPSSQQGGNAG